MNAAVPGRLPSSAPPEGMEEQAAGRLERARVEMATTLLGPGWMVLHDCALPAEADHPAARIEWALLHPARGVALIEAAPVLVPEAVPRLRRRLDAARFRQIYAGHLPIVHLSLPASMPPAELAAQVALALGREGPLMLPGGDAWIGTLRRVLAPGAAAGPSRPLAAPPPLLPAGAEPRRRRRRRRRFLSFVRFWTTTALLAGSGAAVQLAAGVMPPMD